MEDDLKMSDEALIVYLRAALETTHKVRFKDFRIVRIEPERNDE